MEIKSMMMNQSNLQLLGREFVHLQHQQQATIITTFSSSSSSSLALFTTTRRRRRRRFLQNNKCWCNTIMSTSATQPLPLTLTTTPCRPLLRSSPSFPRCSINDEGVNAKVTELDPSLVLKNKAAEISPDMKGTSIFLLGMNCTIKTDLGRILADVLRYYYFDSDALVEQAGHDESATKSFRERDEKGFLETETEVLKQLSSMGRLVVCAGDGAVESTTNLGLMRYGLSIWIDVPVYMIAKEVVASGNGNQSPPVDDTATSDTSEVVAKLAEQYKGMREGYATADATISIQKIARQLGYDSMDAVTVENMAIEVLKEIEKLTRVKKMMEAAARPF